MQEVKGTNSQHVQLFPASPHSSGDFSEKKKKHNLKKKFKLTNTNSYLNQTARFTIRQYL